MKTLIFILFTVLVTPAFGAIPDAGKVELSDPISLPFSTTRAERASAESEVPFRVAFWLLGAGLVGFVAMSRRSGV